MKTLLLAIPYCGDIADGKPFIFLEKGKILNLLLGKYCSTTNNIQKVVGKLKSETFSIIEDRIEHVRPVKTLLVTEDVNTGDTVKLIYGDFFLTGRISFIDKGFARIKIAETSDYVDLPLYKSLIFKILNDIVPDNTIEFMIFTKRYKVL
jgi:hypothetical protein